MNDNRPNSRPSGSQAWLNIAEDRPWQRPDPIASTEPPDSETADSDTASRWLRSRDRTFSIATDLVSIEADLLELERLRAPGTFASRTRRQTSDNTPTPICQIRDRLLEMESSPSSDLSQKDTELQQLGKTLETEIDRLHTRFIALVYPTVNSRGSVREAIAAIGDDGLRREAAVHWEFMEQSMARLSSELPSVSAVNIFDDRTRNALASAVEIEKRQATIESLIVADRSRSRWSLALVLVYLLSLAGAIAVLFLRSNIEFATLLDGELPFLNIPRPVLLWSGVGAIAAIFNRLLRHPLASPLDTVKWLLVRPLQGTIFGCTFYLVLSAIAIVLVGKPSGDTPLFAAEQPIWMLCFLVAFSDRLAAWCFDVFSRPSSVTLSSTTSNK